MLHTFDILFCLSFYRSHSDIFQQCVRVRPKTSPTNFVYFFVEKWQNISAMLFVLKTKKKNIGKYVQCAVVFAQCLECDSFLCEFRLFFVKWKKNLLIVYSLLLHKTNDTNTEQKKWASSSYFVCITDSCMNELLTASNRPALWITSTLNITYRTLSRDTKEMWIKWHHHSISHNGHCQGNISSFLFVSTKVFFHPLRKFREF